MITLHTNEEAEFICDWSTQIDMNHPAHREHLYEELERYAAGFQYDVTTARRRRVKVSVISMHGLSNGCPEVRFYGPMELVAALAGVYMGVRITLSEFDLTY